MYGLVTKGATQVAVANLGRIDRAATGTFFRTYLGEAHGSAHFSHGADGSIVATAGDLRVEVVVDAAEAAYFRAQQLWSAGTLRPGRVRPTWDAVAAAVVAHRGDVENAALTLAVAA